MAYKTRRRSGFLFYLVLSLLAWGGSPCCGQVPEMNAHKLVDQATQAQVAAENDSSRFEYLQQQLEKHDARTYRIVESDAGDVQRLVAINEEDLTPLQSAHENHLLDELIADPSIQQKRQKEDADEKARRQKIIVVLGQAFLYDIEATEAGGQIIRLHFRPNPKFHPNSREAKVCAGLEGTMWIDPQKTRFVRADGTLVRDVDFGWGLFGHLDKGGHFAIEQTEVGPGVWRITSLDVSFKGSMLIFKSLNIKVREHSFSFQSVPDHFSLEDAVEMLRHDSSRTSTPPKE